MESLIELSVSQNTAFPGEVFGLGLEALDEIDRQTSAAIRISSDDDVMVLLKYSRQLFTGLHHRMRIMSLILLS